MSTVDDVARAIAAAPELALACHVGPDGDALGSMLGLGIAATNAGKRAIASFGSPFAVPANLSFLPGGEILVPPTAFPAQPPVMVVFDAGSADRLGELSAGAEAAGQLIVIDHHVTNEGFGDLSLVDPSAAATGQLVFHVLESLGWPITKEVATCLHTALVTDTGRFQYANTTPETLQVASQLVGSGAEPQEISRHVYDEAPFGYLKAAGVALTRAELDTTASLVSTVITQDDLNEAGIDWGDIDNLVNTVRLAEEADCALIAKVHDDGRVKVSLRSRGDTDVGSLAAEMGGGGHRLAAGFTYEGEAGAAIDAVRERIGKYQ